MFKNDEAKGIIYSDNQTAVRFFIEFESQHKDYMGNLFSYMRGVSKWVFSQVKEGRVSKIKPFAIVWNDGTETSDRNFKHIPEIKALIESYFGDEVLSANVDAVNWGVVRMYGSYLGRNAKKMKSAIVIRDKGFAPKSDMFSYDEANNQVLMRKIEKDKKNPHLRFDISNVYYDNAHLLKYTKRSPEVSKPQGGILSLKKGELVLMAREVLEYPKAEKTIGLDINKSQKNWLAFSEEIPDSGEKIFPKPQELQDIEDRIKLLQKRIRGKDKSDDELNSSQRRGVRKKWDKAHKKQAILVGSYVNKILDDFKNVFGEFNLAIDTVAVGASLGTFGQDKIIASSANWCRENKFAYFYVPTPNTSRRCSECGNVSRTARKIDCYVCPKCSHAEHADENAAKNIQIFAQAMIDNSWRMIGTLSRKYKIESMVFLNQFFNLKQ